MRRLLVSAFTAVFVLLGNAVAQNNPLTEDQASRFVKTLPAVQSLADEFTAEGNHDPLEINIKPKAGEKFAPYSKMVTALKKDFPGEHARLADKVKPYGFETTAWGAIGDRVMIAYFAIKMREENPDAIKQMQAFDPKMLEQLPPQTRAQIESVIAMMETMKAAPEADQKVVAKVQPELEAFMEAHETMQPSARPYQ